MMIFKHFSDELSLVFLHVYDSWEKLGTTGVSSRTEIISAIYKKVIKQIFQTKDPSHLDYKIYTKILKNPQETLSAIIGKNHSAATRNRH